ncbi:polyadenylate-binding protein 2-like [Passer domesticus]|uniref:polyadenylate-binding protein 2-like n=1 Tax=Passer domesticus TaxID=48849 RepID=UPI0030FE20D1
MMLPGAARLSRGAPRFGGWVSRGFDAVSALPEPLVVSPEPQRPPAPLREQPRSRSARRSIPGTGPGEEEEEEGLSLSEPPLDHLEHGAAPEHLTRKIEQIFALFGSQTQLKRSPEPSPEGFTASNNLPRRWERFLLLKCVTN